MSSLPMRCHYQQQFPTRQHECGGFCHLVYKPTNITNLSSVTIYKTLIYSQQQQQQQLLLAQMKISVIKMIGI